jgi:hypothetical protein
MKGNFYETQDVMRILCVGKTTACELMKGWKSEISALGKYPGAKGLISKAYVDEKLYLGQQASARSKQAVAV